MVRKIVLFVLMIVVLIVGFLVGSETIPSSVSSPLMILVGSTFTVTLRGLEER